VLFRPEIIRFDGFNYISTVFPELGQDISKSPNKFIIND
jgi:hypothetical protein